MNSKGTTLTEVAVTVAILGVTALMVGMGSHLINNAIRGRLQMEAQKQGQLVLFYMTKDVRNAFDIVHLSSDTLQLAMRDTVKGYDIETNPTLFSDAAADRVVITYKYESKPNENYLQKTVMRGATLLTHQNYLKNMLLRPDEANPMFVECFNGEIMPCNDPLRDTAGHPRGVFPYESVGMFLRFPAPMPMSKKDPPFQYASRSTPTAARKIE